MTMYAFPGCDPVSLPHSNKEACKGTQTAKVGKPGSS